MDIKIEELEFKDIKQYKYLIDNCFENSNNLEYYEKNYNKNDNYIIIVAKDNDKIIGSITLYKIELFTFSFQPAIEIFNVAVLKEYRRKNIAKTLMKQAIDYAINNNFKSMYLTCLDNAYDAHKLYESVGMKKMSSNKYSLIL